MQPTSNYSVSVPLLFLFLAKAGGRVVWKNMEMVGLVSPGRRLHLFELKERGSIGEFVRFSFLAVSAQNYLNTNANSRYANSLVARKNRSFLRWLENSNPHLLRVKTQPNDQTSGIILKQFSELRTHLAWKWDCLFFFR